MTAIREGKHRKPIHLAAHFPGVNNTTVWSDPESGSQIEFDSFVHLARTAERGMFDFFFLAEGLRLREHRGRIHDLDVVGRPDTFTVLAALAGVTERIGLTGTIRYHVQRTVRGRKTIRHARPPVRRPRWLEHGDVVRRLHRRELPSGRILDYADRYRRAEEFITVARAFWDSWADDAVQADADTGIYLDPSRILAVDFHGSQFDVRGVATLPVSPQRHPVLLQAGDSSDGRDFGAKHADALFTLHSALEAGQRYYADVKERAIAVGRNPDQLKVFPAATFVLGDTSAQAADRARYIRYQQVSGPTAIAMLEQVWQRDLSDLDPDGPLPDVEPADDPTITQGRVRHGDPKAVAASWRQRAQAENRQHPRTDHRRHQPPAVRRNTRRGRRRDRSARSGRRLRRLHPGATPDPARSG